MATTRPAKLGIGSESAGAATASGGESSRSRIVWGQVVCVLGLISALVGAFGLDVSLEAVGILFGAVGYALGASRLGIVTVIFSTIALIFLPAIGQGYIPGPWPLDPLAL